MTDELARRRGYPTIAIIAGSTRVVRVVKDQRLFRPWVRLGRKGLIELLVQRRRRRLQVVRGGAASPDR